MPARYEPFGLSILEAALSGCALVLGNIPSMKEIWGDAALYADPDNSVELQSKIQFLIEHDTQRKQMADKAKQRAQYFSTERFGQQYMNLYQKLMSMKDSEDIVLS
jgi:glycosyltransferase involved in cell wall biosynthesis